VISQGVPAPDVTVRLRAHVRYSGNRYRAWWWTAVHCLRQRRVPPRRGALRLASAGEMTSSFEAAHKARFGFIDNSKALVVEAVSIEAVRRGAKFCECRNETDH